MVRILIMLNCQALIFAMRTSAAHLWAVYNFPGRIFAEQI